MFCKWAWAQFLHQLNNTFSDVFVASLTLNSSIYFEGQTKKKKNLDIFLNLLKVFHLSKNALSKVQFPNLEKILLGCFQWKERIHNSKKKHLKLFLNFEFSNCNPSSKLMSLCSTSTTFVSCIDKKEKSSNCHVNFCIR